MGIGIDLVFWAIIGTIFSVALLILGRVLGVPPMRALARNLASAVLLLLAIPLVAGGGFELEGMMGDPKLLPAIALSLAAQLTVLSAGFIASPKEGKVGLPRAIAFTFFLVQAFTLPIFLIALAYEKLKSFELIDADHLIWGLVGSSSAFVLVLVLAKSWHLLKRLPVIN
jgi:hypothetical protein